MVAIEPIALGHGDLAVILEGVREVFPTDQVSGTSAPAFAWNREFMVGDEDLLDAAQIAAVASCSHCRSDSGSRGVSDLRNFAW